MPYNVFALRRHLWEQAEALRVEKVPLEAENRRLQNGLAKALGERLSREQPH